MQKNNKEEEEKEKDEENVGDEKTLYLIMRGKKRDALCLLDSTRCRLNNPAYSYSLKS
jgi:hypothetical protein